MAIKAFIGQAKISQDGVEIPEQSALLKVIKDCLEQATYEGQRIAIGMEQRGIISAAKDLAGRAVQIVIGIIVQLKEKASELIDAILGDEIDPDEIKDQIDEWAEEYSEMVAQTETSAAIEEVIADEMAKQGVDEIYWNDEPDACERCQANAAASPIKLHTDFPSGDTCPPAHPRCRCTTSPA